MSYSRISENELPENVSFEVAFRDQGQIVEVATSEQTILRQRKSGGLRHVPLYRRTTDRSTGAVVYEKLDPIYVEVQIRASAFRGHGITKQRMLVNDISGEVQVFDDVAGHFTRCHSLSKNAVARARREARPYA